MRHGRAWTEAGSRGTCARLDHAVAERASRDRRRPGGPGELAGDPGALGRRGIRHAGRGAPVPAVTDRRNAGAPIAGWTGAGRGIATCAGASGTAAGRAARPGAQPRPPMNPRTDAPAPLRRRGPRPLLLHLTLAMLRSTVSRATSPNSNAASPSSSTASRRRRRPSSRRCGTRTTPTAPLRPSRSAVVEATLRQDADADQRHRRLSPPPYARSLQDPQRSGPRATAAGLRRPGDAGAIAAPTTIMRTASARTTTVRAATVRAATVRAATVRATTVRSGPRGRAALFVPSLVNRAYVLDLAPGHSMLRWLAGKASGRCCWTGAGPPRSSGASP